MHRCVKDIAAQWMQKYVLYECGRGAWFSDMPLSTWMTSSSIAMSGGGIWSIWGLFWERWRLQDSRPTRRCVRLGVWRSDIWTSTWVTDKCVPKLIRLQPLKLVRDLRPKSRWEFLGLVRYYRRFVPNYSYLTSPLTDLTKKKASDPVQWTELCQQAFIQVKAALCGRPLSHSPDFSLPFLLQTNASDRGVQSCPRR